MNEKAIDLKGVWVHYDATLVLKDIHLAIDQNILLGIIGPNGAGKTTLLKIILGLIEPEQGDVRVLGRYPKEARRWVGYVPQRGLIDHDFPINVWDVVLMGRLARHRLFSGYTAEDKASTREALEKVNLLELKDRQIGELSEGERQRVFIARALVNDSKLLLLDEPTASVDQRVQSGLYELLAKLKKEHTIVLISHDIGVISAYVDKIACLNVQLYFHDTKEVSKEDLEAVYGCPFDLIGHGLPHRVVHKH
ncbi:MAG: metal ABC transporter ATP-binding protein [Candidatus Omnitrophica bacterium]|nr:metal ABC transporter ATP-binding protein [Candidatus Omnitrophota bacterium]